MKEIYMSESKMPKDCRHCKMPVEDCPCEIVDAEVKRADDCPLHSLEAHDAEVRKAAIEEFIRIANERMGLWGNLFIGELNDIAKELIKNGQRKD